MSSASCSPELSVTLQRATEELRRIEKLLESGADLDERVLTDFRDAVNRVRTTAWGVQQYAQSRTAEKDPQPVLSVLSGERVRLAYMIFKQILADLDNPEIRFQRSHLLRLQDVAKELVDRLEQIAGE